MLSKVCCCPLWNWHKWSSWIKSDQAIFILADTSWFAIELNIIKLDTIHVFKFDIVPVHITLEFLFIIITKSHVWFNASTFSLLGSQIEREDIVFQQFLIHHFIENWSDTFLSKGWISHTNDGFKVVASEDSLLLLNITELLIFDENLTWWWTITGTNS